MEDCDHNSKVWIRKLFVFQNAKLRPQFNAWLLLMMYRQVVGGYPLSSQVRVPSTQSNWNSHQPRHGRFLRVLCLFFQGGGRFLTNTPFPPPDKVLYLKNENSCPPPTPRTPQAEAKNDPLFSLKNIFHCVGGRIGRAGSSFTWLYKSRQQDESRCGPSPVMPSKASRHMRVMLHSSCRACFLYVMRRKSSQERGYNNLTVFRIVLM